KNASQSLLRSGNRVGAKPEIRRGRPLSQKIERSQSFRSCDAHVQRVYRSKHSTINHNQNLYCPMTAVMLSLPPASSARSMRVSHFCCEVDLDWSTSSICSLLTESERPSEQINTVSSLTSFR